MQVREITLDDAAEAAALSGDLGYPASTEAIEQRIQAATGQPDRAIYVAHLNGKVLGWIDVSVVEHLQSGARAEIGGLVVANGHRGLGIGKKLVERAEAWATERGFPQMLVRSQIAREAAHRFYLREGYERTKTSAVFTKTLGVSTNTLR